MEFTVIKTQMAYVLFDETWKNGWKINTVNAE
jgi:hypothetical protein